jgi:hypothetical protein
LDVGIANAFQRVSNNGSALQESLIGRAPVADFQQKYLVLVESRWPSLRPSDDRFDTYRLFVQELGVGLDDFSDEVLFGNEAFLVQLDRLHAQLSFVTDAENTGRRRLTANMVADLFLSACLVPAASVLGPPEKHDTDLHFDYTAEISRHWIQGVPPELVIEIIKVFFFLCFCFRNLKTKCRSSVSGVPVPKDWITPSSFVA